MSLLLRRKSLPPTKDLIQGPDTHMMSSHFLKWAFDYSQSAQVGIFKSVKKKKE